MVVVVLVALVAASSSPVAVAVGGNPAAGPVLPLPWLHVEHPVGEVPYIADEQGRTVMLRGVNANGIQDDYYDVDGVQPTSPFWSIAPADYDGRCPSNSHAIVDPPLCEVDAGAGLHARSADGSQNDFAQ